MSTFARQQQRRRQADPKQRELASIQPARVRPKHHDNREREERHERYWSFGVRPLSGSSLPLKNRTITPPDKNCHQSLKTMAVATTG